MKGRIKEATLILAIITVTLLVIWFFFGSMKKEKKISEVDLYSLVAPVPDGILIINRPHTFSSMILEHEKMYSFFSRYLPKAFLSILQNSTSHTLFLITFYENNVVITGKTDSKQVKHWEKDIFIRNFSAYPANRKTINDITYSFYPDTLNSFLGYYYHEGVFAASYNKQLLENVAERQSKKTSSSDIYAAIRGFDKNAPFSLIIPANRMDLYVQLNDTPEWRIEDQWLGADLFTNEGKICCYGSIPAHPSSDTLSHCMADTLTLRLDELFPAMNIVSVVDSVESRIYYTGCHELY